MGLGFLEGFGGLQRASQCAGLSKKPREAPRWVAPLATVGGLVIGAFTLVYSVAEYGPLPATLLGAAVAGGSWWALVTAIKCKYMGAPVLLCMGGSATSVVSAAEVGALGFKVPSVGSFFAGIGDKVLDGVGCAK